MRVKAPVIVALALVVSSYLLGQARVSKPQTEPQAKPDAIVHLWFERWNALDGSEQATNKLLELYRPDAFHQTGPTEKQMGQVRYEGHAGIRKMIEDFAKANTEITFRIESATANEKNVQIVHVGEGPWNGPSAAVQYVAAYTTRKDKRRWMGPGAAFFQIQDGKIRGARFYAPREEIMEVFNR